MTYYIAHHGIKGQKWGRRRYQNPDGSLTEAGRKHLEKKDEKWAKKNYNKVYKQTYKKSEKELREYLRRKLNPRYKNQRIGYTYMNEYNKKLAEIMNKNAKSLVSPSGRVVQFVAKRGEVGVHMALADPNYDMSQVKNGIWGSGRVAYQKKQVDMV